MDGCLSDPVVCGWTDLFGMFCLLALVSIVCFYSSFPAPLFSFPSFFFCRVLNSFVADMLQRVGSEAGTLARAGGRKSINLPILAAACRFALPGELGRNAALEGAKAVAKFLES